MSVILFSHPRSGSSHYTAMLHWHNQHKYKNQSIYLFEFFTIHCTDTFGQAGDILYNLELYGKPIQVCELVDAVWNRQWLYWQIESNQDPADLLPMMLKNKTVIFKNFQEVQQWYTAECLKRLSWLKFLTNSKIHYVVKHFFLSQELNIDAELIEFAKSAQQAKLYYRQDFYQTLLSHLIKTCYYDIPGAQQSLTNRGQDAHNIQNKMSPLQPMSLSLEKDQLLKWIDPFVLFLNFVKNNKFDAVDILLYEDFLAKKSIQIDGQEIKLEIIDAKFMRTKEFTMNYAVSKDQYFINSELIKSVVYEKIVDQHLLETMQMLGIRLL